MTASGLQCADAAGDRPKARGGVTPGESGLALESNRTHGKRPGSRPDAARRWTKQPVFSGHDTNLGGCLAATPGVGGWGVGVILASPLTPH